MDLGRRGTQVPLWKQTFPIDTDQEAGQSRRAFLGGLTLASGAMACGQVAFQQLLLPRMTASTWEEASPLVLDRSLTELSDGEALLFDYPDHRSPCVLVRLSESEYVAYAQKCTHLACPVIPEPEEQTWHCPCHHGRFDLRSGAPLAGPAREPLRRVRVEADASGKLTAIAIERESHQA